MAEVIQDTIESGFRTIGGHRVYQTPYTVVLRWPKDSNITLDFAAQYFSPAETASILRANNIIMIYHN